MAQINCVHEYHNKCQLTSFLLIIEINSERIGDAYPSPSPFIKFKHVLDKTNKMTVEQDNKVQKIH